MAFVAAELRIENGFLRIFTSEITNFRIYHYLVQMKAVKAAKAAKKAWVIEFFFSFYFWHLDADNKRQELNSF